MEANNRRRAVSSRVSGGSVTSRQDEEKQLSSSYCLKSIKELIPDLTMEILEHQQSIKENFNKNARNQLILFDQVYQKGETLYYKHCNSSNQLQVQQLPDKLISLYWQTKHDVLKQESNYLHQCIASSVNNALETGSKQQNYYNSLIKKIKLENQKLLLDLEEERASLVECRQKIAILEVKVATLTKQLEVGHLKHKTQMALKDHQLSVFQQLEQNLGSASSKQQKETAKRLKQILNQQKKIYKEVEAKFALLSSNIWASKLSQEEMIKGYKNELNKKLKNDYQSSYLTTIEQQRWELNFLRNQKMFRERQMKDMANYSALIHLELQKMQHLKRQMWEPPSRNQSCFITKYPQQEELVDLSETSSNPSILITYIEPQNPESPGLRSANRTIFC